MPTILSIHYLPCIVWVRHFLNDPDVVLDQHEHFIKQTYRNRCIILSANGPLALTIPVKNTQHKIPIHEAQIENDFNWQKQHWEAIRSAYNSSPFFEHYEHHFATFYKSEFDMLSEWNTGLINLCLKLMKVKKELVLSNTYMNPHGCMDLRTAIHPKKSSGTDVKPYLQVFSSKYPFVPNLSIVDLLFNRGDRSLELL